MRQGLRGEHVLAVCLACALSDAVLIAAGVGGMGTMVQVVPGLEQFVHLGGAAFLLAYGAIRFYAAWKGGEVLTPGGNGRISLRAALTTCLILTWANPHVYLDTVLLLGSVSTRWPDQGLIFGLGAVLSSFAYFFGLGYGAALLRPMFARPAAWQVLEIGIGITMWVLAAGLLMP